jgi:hypothetical protein
MITRPTWASQADAVRVLPTRRPTCYGRTQAKLTRVVGNSISRVLSGCSSSPNLANLS